MANELIINVTQQGYRIALLKEGRLLEYHVDEKDNRFTVGDIYLGTIRKVAPGLNAAFVDIGYKRDAFLHYFDLGAQFTSLQRFKDTITSGKAPEAKLSTFDLSPPIEKAGKISNVLSRHQSVVVQVTKEPISTKGPRLSSELSLAGRYMILVPFSNEINISKKIVKNEERNRLQRLVASIKPNNFGVIIRTVAEGKEAAKLDQDLKDLLQKWHSGIESLKQASPKTKLIGEMNRASSILRDLLNNSFDHIVVDNKKTYEETKQYIQQIAPEKQEILKHYQGKAKLFEHFGIEKQLKALFGQTVNIEDGGYLIIEHTEAMHVIDVNSGSRVVEAADQEEMTLKVNLGAAKEIARQLRLRDMGGIIVVDFIDMKNADYKREVYQTMKDCLKEDRAKTTTLPISRFGLMQITRQRIRPEMNIITQEKCPACGGTGKIEAAILVADQIEKNLRLVLLNQNEKGVTIILHPYLYAYFTHGLISRRLKWLCQYRRWIKLMEDSSLAITEFKLLNQQDEEIDCNA